ncbi:arginine repressor [Boudabousia liubingyangii]|uniref:arginine repressor n=1 Tax=Boudabousia liubingyangii TaxID=1921764 RepID=UPI000938D86F|nr:arginine repressor [Boudabousia liubingyangii]OKL46513.1 arginine repressor [Boudabousia liubingyangii]
MSRAKRLRAIKDLIDNQVIGSQSELQTALENAGFKVTQATISRDLLELGATRVRGVGGSFRYVLSGDHLKADSAFNPRRAQTTTVTIESIRIAQNQIVVRTLTGAAQFLAAAIDSLDEERILGTIAGDDTILLICENQTDANDVAEFLQNTYS